MGNPRVGIGVAIIKDNKVLLGKRKNSHGSGEWAYPGGHLEEGESWKQCSLRETEEEVGVMIKNLRFGAVTNDIFTKENKHYITICIVADYDSGEVELREPEKCEKWQWFEWDQLPEPLFLPLKNQQKMGFNPIMIN